MKSPINAHLTRPKQLIPSSTLWIIDKRVILEPHVKVRSTVERSLDPQMVAGNRRIRLVHDVVRQDLRALVTSFLGELSHELETASAIFEGLESWVAARGVHAMLDEHALELAREASLHFGQCVLDEDVRKHRSSALQDGHHSAE